MLVYCTKKITDELVWIGGNDRRLAMFEGVYNVPMGVSYNSYLLKTNETVLFDTVDRSVSKLFFENLEHELDGKALDYLVIHHMEPDHSATISELLLRYPNVKLICNAKTSVMLGQFFNRDFDVKVVSEGEAVSLGGHELIFVMAPMVHWPEVMMTYDSTSKILFSADAFGHFGALNGSIFADEVDFEHEYMSEARRYYCNIVGKYGTQVQAVLKKAAELDIEYICPLHGFVWRKNLNDIIDKYSKWSSFTPEEKGVLVAYASVYGNTENAAELIASKLNDRGLRVAMYDVSVSSSDEVIAAAFKYSHMIFASTTYNAGIFIKMDEFLSDLVAHNIQNRTVAIVENGSWAPASGRLMREKLSKCKGMTLLDSSLTLKSSLKPEQLSDVDALVDAVVESFSDKKTDHISTESSIDESALFSLSYGLFVLTAKDGGFDNGCIINTAIQISSNPTRIAISVGKQNLTHNMIMKTGMFNLSVLTEDTPFKVFEHFGFQSGRNTDKFSDCKEKHFSANGLIYVPKYTNAYMSCKVISTVDSPSHTLFIAELTEAKKLSELPSVTYSYYFEHIKPKPQLKTSAGRVWVCRICGYIYDEEAEGVKFEDLPDDWCCILCNHPKSDFELQE